VDVEDVRLAVYRGFVEEGRAPSVGDLAAGLGASQDAVVAALGELHAARHLVLDPGGRRVVMAHPFSAVPLGFSAMGARTLWWGGCAWDSFALPHLLPGEDRVLVATTCPGCAAPHAWLVGRDGPPAGDQRAHFLVPAARIRGDVLDLATLWHLAAGWYTGRLDRGYRRREPEAARDYFAAVGLRGPFWGL
jgi:hypothetical protein